MPCDNNPGKANPREEGAHDKGRSGDRKREFSGSEGAVPPAPGSLEKASRRAGPGGRI